MNTNPQTVGLPSPIYQISADALESVVRRIIKDEISRQEAERNDRRVTTSEVVARLHVDTSTLWRWRKSGRLKGVKIGREITYKESDILKLLGE
jgi:predicted DNA-binding transcriptional regulator AlpA